MGQRVTAWPQRARVLLAVLAIGVATVPAVLSGGSAGAVVPGPNGRIVFNSTRDGQYEIYSMNIDGTGQTRLTTNPSNESTPAWSPDGRRVAFESARDGSFQIWVALADGSNPTRVTSNGGTAPAWSPDGQRIAFMRGPAVQENIWVINADGTGEVQLTTDGGRYPDWSPNGSKIAFDSGRSGIFQVYVMNTDGSGQTNISRGTSTDGLAAWSPDGRKLAFISDRDGNREIYTMSADGSNQVRLTNSSGPDEYPAWSPDGTKIAFASQRDGHAQIYAMNADGSNQTRLSNDSFDDDRPDWGSVDSGNQPTTTTTTTSPPVPTTLPPASPTITIAVGQDGGSQRPGGAVAPPGVHWVIVDFHNFQPNSTYTAQCIEDNVTWYVMQNLRTDAGGNGHYTDTCYWGSANSPQVGVLASNGVLSNVIVWPPITAPPPPTSSGGGYSIVTGGSCANVRTGPGTNFDPVDCLPNGTSISIACQVQGGPAYTSDGRVSYIWDLLRSPDPGRYVSDIVTNTPAFNDFSPGLARCPSGPTPPGGGTSPPPISPPGATPTYVALGDSYSSGEGNPPFIAGTDTRENKCHRSTASFVYSVAPSNLQLDHVACSGSIVYDLNNPNFSANAGEGPQLSALSGNTTLVTLSIGGNDLGFAYGLAKCLEPGDCSRDSSLRSLLQKHLDWLTAGHGRDCTDRMFLKAGVCAPASPSLSALYIQIAQRAPNAKIVVLNYPSLFPRNPSGTCKYAGTFGATIDEQTFINDWGLKLNRVIKSQVLLARQAGARIVLSDVWTEFGDHGVCTHEPWIRSLTADLSIAYFSQVSFHPNLLGQDAMARAVLRVR